MGETQSNKLYRYGSGAPLSLPLLQNDLAYAPSDTPPKCLRDLERTYDLNTTTDRARCHSLRVINPLCYNGLTGNNLSFLLLNNENPKIRQWMINKYQGCFVHSSINYTTK